MSTTEDSMPSSCAICGKDGDSLLKCSACKSVKYCSVTCQKTHRKNHKKECRERAAQLFDEALFKQPPRGDECPICFLLLPDIDTGGVVYQPCCGQNICSGCVVQMVVVDTNKCPFCRLPAAKPGKEWNAMCNKRMEAGDADAFYELGSRYYKGGNGLPEDQMKAFELWSRAAELGSANGHCSVGTIYSDSAGKLVERDLIKAVYHWEQAAMLGYGMARHNLGWYEEAEKGNSNRAMKHWIIAAGAGQKNSLDTVRRFFSKGCATKADYEKALRDYQKYMDEVSSDQRDRAASWTGRC